MRSPCTTTRDYPSLSTLEKSPNRNEDPAQPKINEIKLPTTETKYRKKKSYNLQFYMQVEENTEETI